MSLNSSRLAIGKSLVAILATLTDPVTSAPLYPLTKLGAVYDPGANAQWAQVTHFHGQGKPAGSGGSQVGWRIDDTTTWIITSGFGPYQTSDSTSQAAMLNAQDILLPALHTHFQLPLATDATQAVQSVYSVLPIEIDRSQPLKFPNGNIYLLWYVPVIVKQQYNVELVTP